MENVKKKYRRWINSIQNKRAFAGIAYLVGITLLNPPGYLIQQNWYTEIDLYLKLMLVLFAAVIALLIWKKDMLPFLVCINLFYGIQLVATIYNHQDVAVALWGHLIVKNAVAVIIAWIFIEAKEEGFAGIKWAYACLLMVNLATVIYFVVMQQGDGVHFFYGNYNNFIEWMLPAQIVAYLDWKVRGMKSNLAFLLVMCTINFFTLLYVGSVTGILVCILLGFLLFCNLENLKHLCNNGVYCTVNVLLVLFVLLQGYQNPTIMGLTETLFHKSITLSGRTLIWDHLIPVIKQNLILGRGVVFSETALQDISVGSLAKAHNMFLEILYYSGILGILTFMIMTVLVMRTIGKLKNYPLKNTLYIMIACFLFSCHTEDRTGVLIFIYAICYFGAITLYRVEMYHPPKAGSKI